jgi:cell division protein FtsW
MFFIGRVAVKHILLLALIGLLGLLLLYGASKAFGFGRGATWEERIESYMGNGEKGDNYQTTQAKIAIASGGFVGRGPGNSWARDFLPHPYSDFIYSIIIEEYGLLGGILLIGIYLLFLWRSILIFRRIPYAFGAFLAVGLSFTLVFQALMNMAVNVHLVPVTGLTLPLVSMGGSSILFNSVAIGIILSVSRYVDEMEGEEAKQIMKQIKE